MSYKNIKDLKKILSLDDICDILEIENPYEKAEFIHKYINDICIMKKEELYVKMKNDVFMKTEKPEALLLTVISKLMLNSFNALNDAQLKNLKRINADYNIIGKNLDIKKYIPQLTVILSNEEIIFNHTPYEIHFNNGYVDVRDKKLYKRTDKHFITKYIKRDYKPSTEKERDKYYKILKQIYPVKEDLELILTYFAIALSGKAPTLSESLFLIGKGSSGKSTLINHIQYVFECYFTELTNDAFSNEKKMDKVLNTFAEDPQILFTWINEMESKKCNASVYKSFCDGQINTTKMYKDSSFSTKHNSLCISTSNELPNIAQDSGSKRRMKGMRHISIFTSDPEKVDEKNNIYLKDTELHDKVKHLYNAIFDIYCSYCSDWLSGKKKLDTSTCKNLKETTELICETNDYFKDFIDKNLTFTTSDNDRIGKEEMRKLFLTMYPDKHMNILNVISALTDKGLKYSKDFRYNGVKGAFYCVKYEPKKDKDNILDDPDEPTMASYKIEDITTELEIYYKKIKKLEERLLTRFSESMGYEPIEEGVEKKEYAIKQPIENDDNDRIPKKKIKTKPIENKPEEDKKIFVKKECIIKPEEYETEDFKLSF